MANAFEKLVINTVKNQLNIFINEVAEEARRNAPTKRISENIEVDPAKDAGGIVYATLGIKLDDAPEARAYEYGSGLHGKMGKKYPIAPRNAPMMIFWWKPPFGDLTGGNLPWLFTMDGTEGLIGFSKAIQHPGVKAKPYLRPAFQKYLKGFRGRMLKALKVEIGFGFKERTIEE